MSSPTNYEQKCWGQVLYCWASWHTAVSYLKLIPKTRCSWHRHHSRANHFICLSGTVVIEMGDLDERQQPQVTRRVILNAGDSWTISALTIHRFRVLEGGDMIEVYWCDGAEGGTVSQTDIERFDTGGDDLDQPDFEPCPGCGTLTPVKDLVYSESSDTSDVCQACENKHHQETNDPEATFDEIFGDSDF